MTSSFSELLSPAQVMLDLAAADEDEAIRAVTAMLAGHPAVADADRLADEVIEREQLSSTAMGCGVAFPHARTELVREIVVAVGRSAEGVVFQGADERSIFFFVIGTPPDRAPQYLALVGALARLLKNEAVRQNSSPRRTPTLFSTSSSPAAERLTARMDAPRRTRTGRWLLPLLKLRIWLAEFARHNELQTTLLWAGVVGFLGGASSVGFRKLTEVLLYLLTGARARIRRDFPGLPPWQRLVTPAAGGALAGSDPPARRAAQPAQKHHRLHGGHRARQRAALLAVELREVCLGAFHDCLGRLHRARGSAGAARRRAGVA